jgi:hypothetical protein
VALGPIELEFRVLIFTEGGKPEYPEKNPRVLKGFEDSTKTNL